MMRNLRFYSSVVFILTLSVSAAVSFADAKDDITANRKKLCVDAGGTPENTVVKVKTKSLHVDCKCGEFGFSPHSKGDICRNNKILPEFDHYCLDSKGEIKAATKDKGSVRQCMCGNNVIEKPSSTTMCVNGAVVVKQHAPELSL
jgi:hypothetical protein